jgi:hypothetical protein
MPQFHYPSNQLHIQKGDHHVGIMEMRFASGENLQFGGPKRNA